MFIVFENNPQLFNVSDGLKLFHKGDEAARYALNRGFVNPYGTTAAQIVAALSSPGKGLTGGGTGVAITIANIDPVDVAENAAPVANTEELDKAVELSLKLAGENAALSKELESTKDNLAENVNTIAVQLEESEKKVAELQAQLAAATEAQKVEAPAATTTKPGGKKPPAAETTEKA
jgi:hypothetical protein